MNAVFRRRLEEFAQDNRSGSAEIALNALEILGIALKSSDTTAVKYAAMSLINGQPSMAAVINVVNRFCLELEKQEAPLNTEAESRFIKRLLEDFRAEQARTVTTAVSKIKEFDRIATYSRSSLVEKTLLACAEKKPNFKVVLSEGRPGCEGVTMAVNLAKSGIEVTLCVDAALPGLMKQCDLFTLGADAVTGAKFCNKIGSGAICGAARSCGIPVNIIASEDKLLAPSLQKFFRITDRPPTEILKENIPKVKVFNRLFEWCDNSMVDEFIVGDAVFDADEIGKRAQTTIVSKLLRGEDLANRCG